MHNSKYGLKSWTEISKQLFLLTGKMQFRTPKQCREHFYNYLDPSLKKYFSRCCCL